MPLHKASNVATYSGSAVAFLGGMTANEIAAFGGLIIAALGFATGLAVNIWYKLRLLEIAAQKGVNAGGDE